MILKDIAKFIIALALVAIFVIIVGLITNKAYEPIRGKGPGYTLPEPEIAQVEERSAQPESLATTTPTEQPATPTATEQPVSPTTSEQPATSETVETASLASLLANADIEAGAKVAKKCIACHSVTPDLKSKVGPPLYNIVGQPLAHTEEYKYSKIFIQLKDEGKVWTFENLNEFLKGPKDFAPKTKMTYSGIKSDEDRANLLVYLQSLSENPVPLPNE